MAKLNNVKGKLNKNLPPNANKIAKSISPKKIKTLNCLDIFFTGALTINFSKK